MDPGEASQIVIPAAAGRFGAWWGASIIRKSAREAEKQAEQRRRRADIVELRAAALLLTEQLRNSRTIITHSVESKRWIHPRSSAFDRAGWETSRVAIARLVDEPEWDAILKAVDTAIGFERMAEELEGPFVMEGQEELLESFSDDIEQAIEFLRRYRTAGAFQGDLGMGIRAS